MSSLTTMHMVFGASHSTMLAPHLNQSGLSIPNTFAVALQELSEHSWRGDIPAPLEALKGTGEPLIARSVPFAVSISSACKSVQALHPLSDIYLQGQSAF